MALVTAKPQARVKALGRKARAPQRSFGASVAAPVPSARLPYRLRPACPLVALSGRSADRVARSGSGRKADIPNQRVEGPLMSHSGHSGLSEVGEQVR